MTTTLFPHETQAGMDFPAPLTEKYRPQQITDFVGMERPKAVLSSLLRSPRPCALLLIGPPGAGKTSMALALARQLNAGLIHLASARLTVDAVAETLEHIQYYPPNGEYWVIVADEADRMSYQAQLALLSPLDCTATLRPKFGGGFEQGAPLKVIWIFTCNGQGENGTEPPDTFEKRFLSRCLPIPFDAHKLNGDLTAFLAKIWQSETSAPAPDLEAIANSAWHSVRYSLQALELELLAAPPVKTEKERRQSLEAIKAREIEKVHKAKKKFNSTMAEKRIEGINNEIDRIYQAAPAMRAERKPKFKVTHTPWDSQSW